MKRFIVIMLIAAAGPLCADDIPGIPRDSNTNNTQGYESTRVQALLNINVKDDTRMVHFIRDNNDPRVITKTYILKNVDAYEFRDYLRQMVQSKRVGNATLQQQYPGNTASPWVATASAPELTPASVQEGYNPAVQLGSNTAVECLKYVDGTGLLIVSAEEYRFSDNENGMGIDSLVAALDDPALGALNYGSQMFIYMPRFVPARNLQPLIENVGMNISDVTELWQGQDLVAYDPDLNWLIFDVENYSCFNIARMLGKYDVPIPQVRLKISVYELYDENDDKIGIDFQSWKNNEGADFFSVGGRYRNNWTALYSNGVLPDKALGSERTSFYNFNPKWNTRYIDFLVSKGKAELMQTGELCIRNNTAASLSRTTDIFYINTEQSVPDATTLPDYGVGPYELLSAVLDKTFNKGSDYPVAKGQQQIVTASTGYGFTMTVNNASVNLKETLFDVELNNTSLIGFQSNGVPRIAQGNSVTQTVSLPHGKNRFVIGGLTKQTEVKSKTGVPWLMDIPYLEYIFSTESKSIKTSKLFVVAECEWESPSDDGASGTSRSYTKGSAIL